MELCVGLLWDANLEALELALKVFADQKSMTARRNSNKWSRLAVQVDRYSRWIPLVWTASLVALLCVKLSDDYNAEVVPPQGMFEGFAPHIGWQGASAVVACVIPLTAGALGLCFCGVTRALLHSKLIEDFEDLPWWLVVRWGSRRRLSKRLQAKKRTKLAFTHHASMDSAPRGRTGRRRVSAGGLIAAVKLSRMKSARWLSSPVKGRSTVT